MKTFGPLVRVRRLQPLHGFWMQIEFEDGTIKQIDLDPFLRGPIFEPIRNNPEMFRRVKVQGGTITWENGADIDPDVLYYDLKPAWMAELEPA